MRQRTTIRRTYEKSTSSMVASVGDAMSRAVSALEEYENGERRLLLLANKHRLSMRTLAYAITHPDWTRRQVTG